MGKIIDLVGCRYGKLIVISFAGATHRGATWLCLCDCGKNKTATAISLRTGNTASCGCLKGENSGRKLGNTPKRKTHDVYRIWIGMKSRCYNPREVSYKYYGAKGVILCDEWKYNFKAFAAHIGLRPSKQHTIDRFPNSTGNYEPGNVRWATWKEQINNRANVPKTRNRKTPRPKYEKQSR